MNPMFTGLAGRCGLTDTFEATDGFAVDLASMTSPPLTPGKYALFSFQLLTTPLPSLLRRKGFRISESSAGLGLPQGFQTGHSREGHERIATVQFLQRS